MKILFCTRDRVFKEGGKRYRLSEELGWWDERGNIYVWAKDSDKLKILGVLAHEVVESFLVRRIHLPRKTAHTVANIVEFIVSFGKSRLYW